MATYRKLLKNANGDTILPVTGYMGDYSTTEQDTGYTWIDGYPIYKKTIDNLNLPSSRGGTSTAHGISNLRNVIKIEAINLRPDGDFFPLNFGDGGNNDTVIYVNSTSVCIYSVSGRAGYAFATLYYTKNTI